MTKKNAINWFELYVSDFARAQRFYEAILQTSLQIMTTPGCDSESKESAQMGLFPCDHEAGVGGAIVKMSCGTSGAGGTLVYLNVEGDLDGVISRIPAAGGSIIMPRKSIGEHGFIAIFKDSEGNAVGLHSMK